jgi:hypothetical protein
VRLEDLERFFPPDEAAEAMQNFDVDGNGSISLAEMQKIVEDIHTARVHLAATLNDTRTIVGKLERILGICIHILFTFFYLLIWNVSPSAASETWSGFECKFG